MEKLWNWALVTYSPEAELTKSQLSDRVSVNILEKIDQDLRILDCMYVCIYAYSAVPL